MNRLKIGFLAGVVTMYFLDPESGAERRRRWTEWWERNRRVRQAIVREAAPVGRQLAQAGQDVGHRVARSATATTVRLRARFAR